jgi:hypothetical protein
LTRAIDRSAHDRVNLAWGDHCGGDEPAHFPTVTVRVSREKGLFKVDPI